MKRTLAGLAMAFFAFGCEQQSVKIEKVEAGSECPNGGLRLFVNNKPPEVVCNGTNGNNGVQTLVTQTAVPNGDARCPRGGAEVSSGADNGGNGGTANDGVLQSGEVTSTSVICNGDDGARVGSFDPPGGAPGTATIRANGGEGSSGMGGPAGRISISQSPTFGGHVKVWKTGRASAAFTVPTPLDPVLGDAPLRITTDTTIPYSIDPTTIAAGSPYMNEYGLFFSQGQALPPKPVTGLTVAATATLTLPLLYTLYDNDALDTCRIDGKVTWDHTMTGTVFGLLCGELVFSATSSVDAVGAGNQPRVSARFEAQGGHLLALGPIDASADPMSEAQGGVITLHGLSLYVTGNLKANGYAGGSIQLSSALTLANRGQLTARGVPTGTRGGRGGEVSLWVGSAFGELRNGGDIDVSGSINTCGECSGGSGGRVVLSTRSTALINDANLSARGGEGDQGGNGGQIQLSIGGESSRGGLPGSMLVSGNLDVSAGSGGSGSIGGNITLSGNDAMADGAEIILLGYASLEANGGRGTPGGAGGDIDVLQTGGGRPAGAVLTTADFSARGGETLPSAPSLMMGGSGGNIQLATASVLVSEASTWELLRVTGTLDVSGAQGPMGGHSGTVLLRSLRNATLAGTFTARGGTATGENGGNGGPVEAMALAGDLDNTANIDVSAGNSGGVIASSPGRGGRVGLAGFTVSNSGTHRARGGSGNTSGGTGGSGGTILFASSPGHTTRNTVMAPDGIDVSGGAAATKGLSGIVSVDGVIVTGSWTH
ncbi:MAG: hypothetical protein ACOZQL_19785 [Myxococcota bacterium]